MLIRPITGRFSDDSTPVFTHWEFDERDPLVVSLYFKPPESMEGEPIVWGIGRDHFFRALDGVPNFVLSDDGPIRDVDCRVPSQPDEFLITLRSPDGCAHLSYPLAEVRGFLELTNQRVPSGSEAENKIIQDALERMDWS